MGASGSARNSCLRKIRKGGRKKGRAGGREGRKKGGRERKYFSFINETVRWFIRGIIQVYRLERNTDKRAWIKNKAKHPSVASEIA